MERFEEFKDRHPDLTTAAEVAGIGGAAYGAKKMYDSHERNQDDQLMAEGVDPSQHHMGTGAKVALGMAGAVAGAIGIHELKKHNEDEYKDNQAQQGNF